MSPDHFVAWLQGFFEALGDSLSKNESLIREHLLRVQLVPPQFQLPASPRSPCGCGGGRDR